MLFLPICFKPNLRKEHTSRTDLPQLRHNWNRIELDYFSWKGLAKLSSPTARSMLLRALSKYLLNTDCFGASTPSLRSPLQCFNILLVKKCFLMSSLNHPCTALNHSHMSCHWIPGRRAQDLPLLFRSSGRSS